MSLRSPAPLLAVSLLTACGGVVALPSESPTPPASVDDCTEPVTWYEDLDGDGYGTRAELLRTCGIPEAGWSLRRGDCDDEDDGTYPGAIEVCDGVDRDCSGVIDDATVGARAWYDDWDRDGFPDLDSEPVRQCTRPADHLSGDLPPDCDDRNPEIYPGAPDPACDGIDQSCGGTADEVARIDGEQSFDTVDAALVAGSLDGGAVLVCPGSYPLDAVSLTGAVDVRGGGESPDDVVFTGAGGRLLEITGPSLSLQNLTLRGGRADGDGGAVLAQVDTLDLRQLILEDHRAGRHGGAIAAVVTERAYVSVMRAADTVAGGDGGLAHLHCVDPIRCDLGLSGSVTGSEAGGRGGVAFMRSEARSASVGASVQAEDTRAAQQGGVFAVEGRGDVALRGVGLTTEGTSASDGGVLHLLAGGHAELSLIAADLRDSTVTGSGGFVRVDGVGVDVRLSSSTLTGGTAARGGQLSVLTSGGLEVWVFDTVLRLGEASAGASILVEGLLDDDASMQLQDARIRDQTGGPAVEVDATLRRSDPLQLQVVQGELTGNAGGGVAVPSSAEVRLDGTRVPLDTRAPNGPFDVRIGTETFTLTEAPTRSTVLRCDEACP